MEMHQIRYFLAVARTLNFTRAAEECHVAQPSLTRAIKLLEAELGGELFRRERNLSHLTDLGHRMMPLMQQCYDSAASAKSLATSIKSGDVAPLQLGLSRTVSIDLLIPQLKELTRCIQGLELKFQRGTALEVGEALKKGEIDLGIAGPLPDSWERFDHWQLFSENFSLVVNEGHPFTGRNAVDLADLKNERLLSRPYCEHTVEFMDLLKSRDLSLIHHHDVASDNDVLGMLKANVGVAVLPDSIVLPPSLRRLMLNGVPCQRTVHVYGVAGRPRAPAAATLLKLLRATDWPQQAPSDVKAAAA